MICRELKNLSDNLLGMKRRFSVRKRNLNLFDELNPLTESNFDDDIQSSSETIKKYNKGDEDESQDNGGHAKNIKLPFTDHNHKLIITNTSKSLKNEKKNEPLSSKIEKKTTELQEEWSFTWYDFDGRGKMTKKDMSTVMKSLYEIIRQNAKNHHSKFIDQYRLHLLLMPTDLSNVQGLDLATSYEQIYQVNSVLTSLTNLSAVSSEDDIQGSNNTINNDIWSKQKNELLLKPPCVAKKSFSGRCFEELQEMRARHKEKRSKSTPTKNSKRIALIDDNSFLNNNLKNDSMATSSSLMTLAGSNSNVQCTKISKQKKLKTKVNKNKYYKKNYKMNAELNRMKILSTSLQNISINRSENELILEEEKYKEKQIKIKNKQKLKKDLGRMYVKEWLLKELPCDLSNSNKPVLHHYHHHYYKQSDDKPTYPNEIYGESKFEDTGNKTFEYQNHIHVHHHHHHYFY